MKHYKKLLSLLLCLALTFTMVTVGVTAYAQDGSETTGEKETRDSDTGTSSSGMEISKTATANNDETYTIQLEAYATGSKVISEVKKDIPTDIVLVLDQSGSMANKMGTVSFRKYTQNITNLDHYERRHNGGSANLWYKLDDGSYASVSVEKQENTNEKLLDIDSTINYSYHYYSNSNNLYEKVGDGYEKVTVNYSFSWGRHVYTYTFFDKSTVTSTGYDTTPDLGSHAPLYTLEVDDTKTVYTYTYTDQKGEIQTIGTSTGDNTNFEGDLYQRTVSTDGGNVRLDALVSAVTTFSKSVAEKAAGPDGDLDTTADNINHRIAIAGFSSNGYNNTELLTGVDITTGNKYYGTDPVTGNSTYYYPTGYEKNGASYYSGITDGQYKNALQSMNELQGQENVKKAIKALTAHGGTMINQGLEMANNIFKNNPVESGKRNRVIIVFTDGAPGEYGNWQSDSRDTANSAIAKAYTSKNTYDATVYTVGVFSGADATNPSVLPTYYTTKSPNTAEQTSNSNRFMHLLSSNYPKANSMSDTGSVNSSLNGKSYYLSAADSSTLSNIFQQISDQIESGGSSTSLSEETVIKDIIAPAFSLPEGTKASDINVETYSCIGKANGEYIWKENADAMGATAAVNGDQVSVTGFDFAKNYVGTVTENGNVSYRGDKLVIKFTVAPKAGFLGGNNVYTNTSAGVYENSTATTPILTFERPQVNVSIPDITVDAQDKNVYLLGNLTGAQLKEGATATAGNVTIFLDPTAENYELETWQTEYVQISVEYLDREGATFTELSELKNDQTYTLKVTISPKEDAASTSCGEAAAAKGNRASANINVYKPALTFQDSTGFYGDTVPEFAGNLTGTVWKHGESVADTAAMGAAPTLTLTYTPEQSKVSDGKINTKQDIAVNADVKIGKTNITDYTTFLHTNCSGKTCTVPTGKEFLIHVKTCRLNITKAGGTSDESYAFDIYKDGAKYSEVTIRGNDAETIYELPVGTYTIREDTGWSWRYPNPSYSSNVELSKDNRTGTITCTNTKNAFYWLNGFSEVVENIFGKTN